jgi:secreted trypsin-like serine protease
MRSREYFGKRAEKVVLCCSILALLLSIPAAAQARDGAQASIIGGRAATVEEFPSLAYVESREGQRGSACTGTVVAPRVVLTAGHCIEDLERGRFTPAGNYAVATGTTTLGKALRENVFRVVETYVFPGFDPGSLRGDAGILVLDRPTAAPPIPLAGPADAAFYAGGAPVQVAGWGVTRPNAADGPESLRATSMVVQPPSFCEQKTRRYYPPYSPASHVCTLDVPTKKSGGCFGDSGGPLIGQRADGTQVELGVVSTGGPFCSTKLPNVFTRVDFISTWVAQWIAAIETGAPPPAADPATPFPLMTRPVAESFAAYTLQDAFGRRFERAKRVVGRCKRTSRSRFRCQVAWIAGREVFAGIVSPFYVRRSQGVAWGSHFRIEWARLECLQAKGSRCPIHTKRG